MKAIFSESDNVHFNLATEEYLLKNFTEDIVFLYVNAPCVVVGKHQNALAETDYPFLMAHDIPVARRLSGGGTVFHDKGNLNFSFIRNFTESQKSVDFKGFLDPVMACLNAMGIPAEYSDRNDLLVEGKKFSGNAEHVYQQGKRTLHHGTILFDSKLDELGKAITNKGKEYSHSAVASVRSEVSNVSKYLKNPVEIREFALDILGYFLSHEDAQHYFINEVDKSQIDKLVYEKYGKWDWNIAYSPKYELKSAFEYENANYSLNMSVEKGFIMDFALFNGEDYMEISSDMVGKRLVWGEILKMLKKNLSDGFAQILTEKLF